MKNRIKDRVLEKIIKGNNLTLIELCEELGYIPQQHKNFCIIDGKLQHTTENDNYKDYIDVTIKDLLECETFIEHINIYLNNKDFKKSTYFVEYKVQEKYAPGTDCEDKFEATKQIKSVTIEGEYSEHKIIEQLNKGEGYWQAKILKINKL